MMSASDFQICREAAAALMSSEHSKKNYLFLEPVDLAWFPTYTQRVKRPMDLGTLSRNLEAGMYGSRSAFFQDAMLCFENAVMFHSDNPETQWILKLAKDMMKIVGKEKKRADKKADATGTSATSGPTTLKLNLGKSDKHGSDQKTKLDETTAPVQNAKPAKVTLSLKPSALDTSVDSERSDQSFTSKKKKKKHLQTSAAVGSTTPSSSLHNAHDTHPITTKSPKLKLSLKLNPPSTPHVSVQPLPPPTSSQISKTKKNDSHHGLKKADKIAIKAKPTKIKSKLNLSFSKLDKNATGKKERENNAAPIDPVNAPSRGKELPSSVATTQVEKPSNKNEDAFVKKSASNPSRGKELPKGTTSSSENKHSDGKPQPKIRLSIPSRGKELPKGVSEPTDFKKTISNEAKKCTASYVKKVSTTSLNAKKSIESKMSSAPLTTADSKKSPEPKPPTAKGMKLSFSQAKKAPLSIKEPPAHPLLTVKPILPPPPPPVAVTVPTITYAAPFGAMMSISGAVMTPARKAQCSKALSALKRRNPQNAGWFLKPVNDPRLTEDYKAKIPCPMDLGTVNSKLEKDQYTTVAEFVQEVRRVFANCLRYNADFENSFRLVACEMLASSEDLLQLFVAKPEAPSVIYPRLLYCWKTCLELLEAILKLRNPDDGHMTAHYFLHPVSFYFGGDYPPEYLEKVKTPMDLGTVTSKLFEGVHQSVGAFVADCRLICENCKMFYNGRKDGDMFTGQAARLELFMAQQLGALVRYDQSPAGFEASRAFFNAPLIKIAKPPKTFLASMMQELRNTPYTDKFTKLTESATLHFEKPVDLSFFPDYLQLVDTPIDLETIDRKIENGSYETPEDFEYDTTLVFRNCEKYNAPKHNHHIIQLAKHCIKTLRKIYSSKMKSFEASGGMAVPVEENKERKRTMSPPPIAPPTKKLKTETLIAGKPGKTVPKISFGASASLVTVPPAPPSRSKSPKLNAPKKKDSVKIEYDGPIPMHVAIAQIKETFPVRRSYKMLESWDGACSRFFRELSRHPWISAARPKFIFHVPVPILFPEIKEAYAAKIANPMDLTTAECKLLQGGIYNSPQEFIDDVALVFANAVAFNRAGHDEGEPMSCAYYDASRHLLRYSRWLSLDYLSPYLTDDEPSTEGVVHQGPISKWKLTKSYKKDAREELEGIVLKQAIEKSEEGDRFTWMESECEKLLKSLRHQSDLRYMTFFIQANYPQDYTAYVSRPTDWEKCQRTLQQRNYDTFGDIVEDLRLIFSNALKYNLRAKGTDTDSGRAYDSALRMSAKLEAAIDRLLLAISDKLERDKIDRVIEEREVEAAERAEEERIRTAWQKEIEKAKVSIVEVKNRVETLETVKVIQRSLPARKEMTDFEFPFYDEDDGHHHHEEFHMDVLRQQKILHEKQQKDRVEMQKSALALGVSVFARLSERLQAIAWAKKMCEKEAGISTHTQDLTAGAEATAGRAEKSDPSTSVTELLQPSKVLESINNGNREQVKLSLPKDRKHKKKKPFALVLE